ncbi:MAG: Mut7-C RNAse domain-containing protein [Bryobacteraceae bacterium]
MTASVPVWFRFHDALNDFLPPDKRDTEFETLAGASDTVKHLIESLGVPHTEVGHVTVNGAPRELSQQTARADHIQVFPYTEPVQVENIRFVLDGHLGRLAAYLRMLGLDTWYRAFADDPELASVASTEQRVLLTRDVGLLKRREVKVGYCVRSQKPHVQLREVARRFALHTYFAPFQRCMECNAPLAPVLKSEVAHLLPPHTRETKKEFSQCPDCKKIFWRGSHHARMAGWIEELVAEVRPPGTNAS